MPGNDRIHISLDELMIRRVRHNAFKAMTTDSIVVEAALQELFSSADLPRAIAMLKDSPSIRRRRR
jgi:hypothetical protein